ncbi:MAG TPA: hypothetical protein ENK99_06440, partial [Campylobacterales bacterium]|nr:hypothetical protein [Campylobacterales bacterium]
MDTAFLDDLCADPDSEAACLAAGGACHPWVRLQATELTERDDLVTATTFEYSLNGIDYFPIGTDTVPNDPP